MFKFGLSEGFDWMAENDDIQSYSGGGQNENEGIPNTFKGGFYLDQKFKKGAKVRFEKEKGTKGWVAVRVTLI